MIGFSDEETTVKRAAVLLVAILILCPGIAGADHLGVFADVWATECSGIFPPYSANTVYLYALLRPGRDLVACEFNIASDPLYTDLPLDGISMTFDWLDAFVTGTSPFDTENGFALRWPEPQPGPLVLLGTIEFAYTGFSAEPMPDDVHWCIVANVFNDAGEGSGRAGASGFPTVAFGYAWDSAIAATIRCADAPN